MSQEEIGFKVMVCLYFVIAITLFVSGKEFFDNNNDKFGL